MLVELLASDGNQVASACGGQQALAKAHAARPDVILLDLTMPTMNGLQFREAQLKDPKLASVPVVEVSAFENTLNVGAVIRKPFLVEDALDTASRLTV